MEPLLCGYVTAAAVLDQESLEMFVCLFLAVCFHSQSVSDRKLLVVHVPLSFFSVYVLHSHNFCGSHPHGDDSRMDERTTSRCHVS